MGNHLIATWLRFAREEINIYDVCSEYEVGSQRAEVLMRIGRREAIKVGAWIH